MSAWTLRQYTMKLSYQLFLLFALNTLGHLNISFSIMHCTYRKVASSRPSQLVAHFQIFRRLMKGKIDAYGLCVTFGQKVPKFNSIDLRRQVMPTTLLFSCNPKFCHLPDFLLVVWTKPFSSGQQQCPKKLQSAAWMVGIICFLPLVGIGL